VGQDPDGVTNPFEAGLARMVRMDKPFFIGQRSLQALQRRGGQQQLIGFTIATRTPLAESHLAIHAGSIIGRITSIAWSETLGRTVGLALLSPAHAVFGGTVQFRDDAGAMHAAQLAATPFYDAAGERQRIGVLP